MEPFELKQLLKECSERSNEDEPIIGLVGNTKGNQGVTGISIARMKIVLNGEMSIQELRDAFVGHFSWNTDSNTTSDDNSELQPPQSWPAFDSEIRGNFNRTLHEVLNEENYDAVCKISLKT